MTVQMVRNITFKRKKVAVPDLKRLGPFCPVYFLHFVYFALFLVSYVLVLHLDGFS